MSSYGEYAAYLEKERKEQIRREQERIRREAVREETIKNIREIENHIVELSKAGLSSQVHEEISIIRKEQKEIHELVHKDVDEALEKSRLVKSKMMELVELSKNKQMEQKIKIDNIKIGILAELDRIKHVYDKIKYGPHRKIAEDVSTKLEHLLMDYSNGLIKGINEKLLGINKEISDLEKEIIEIDIREAERKYILRSIKKTMDELGFITGKPKINTETDLVTIHGADPSGRKIMFRIGNEGKMEFDLDGYRGHDCAKDLEKIQNIMVEKFSVISEPPQYIWKNPDKISKGSKDLPIGGKTRIMKGGR